MRASWMVQQDESATIWPRTFQYQFLKAGIDHLNRRRLMFCYVYIGNKYIYINDQQAYVIFKSEDKLYLNYQKETIIFNKISISRIH